LPSPALTGCGKTHSGRKKHTSGAKAQTIFKRAFRPLQGERIRGVAEDSPSELEQSGPRDIVALEIVSLSDPLNDYFVFPRWGWRPMAAVVWP
jgi:hypothetical protein